MLHSKRKKTGQRFCLKKQNISSSIITMVLNHRLKHLAVGLPLWHLAGYSRYLGS
jgi:hypothetical protein